MDSRVAQERQTEGNRPNDGSLGSAVLRRTAGASGTLALGDRLFAATTLWEELLDDGRWVLFAPDAEGLPVVVPSDVHALLQFFTAGQTIGVAMAEFSDPELLQQIGFLIESGFLSYEPSPARRQLPPMSAVEPPSRVEAWVHLTNGCNLRCSYCFVGERRERMMTEAVACDVATRLATTAISHGLSQVTVKFAGGEPTLALARAMLLRDELESRLRGSSTQARFALISNGTVLNEEVLSFLRRPSTSLTISLDGYGEIHDTHRIYKSTGRGSWSTIAANLEQLATHGLKPFIAATISSETCDALPELLRWLNERGLRSRLNIVRQADCSWQRTETTDTRYASLCDRLATAFDRAFVVMQGPEFSFDFVSTLRICDLHFDAPILGACGIGYNHIVVRPNGRVVDCPMSINDRGVEPGDDLLQACAKSVSFDTAGRNDNDECLGCQWFSVCAGGCPITNHRLNGQAYSRSPFCGFYRRAIPGYLRLLAHKMVQLQREGERNGQTH
jgi:uncharacterized protein